MSYWPQSSLMPRHQLTISHWSANGVLAGAGNGTAPFSGGAGNVNRIYAYPFSLQRMMLVQRAYWFNGTTVAGNIKVGIYGTNPSNPSNGQEVKLTETATTAQAGTSAIQSASIGPINLPPGLYWAAILTSLATTFFRASNNAPFSTEEARHMGCYKKDEAGFALPASLATPHAVDFILPVFGLATQTVI
ncbi:MAG TPA: hypothetical protein VJL59_05550 [Anaerolineales bacterium]|nr:hypothetical protein [Anaerolineales bacterium]